MLSFLKKGLPPTSPKSWRPITLLNTDNKLVATVVHSRLRPVIPTMISPCQACAVPGRSIFANLTLIKDALEYAQLKHISGAFISLDQAISMYLTELNTNTSFKSFNYSKCHKISFVKFSYFTHPHVGAARTSALGQGFSGPS